MKIFAIILCAAFISFNAQRHESASRIIGSATPVEGINKIAAYDGKDSVFTNTSTGTFALAVHAGNWKLIVLAIPPYKNAIIENVIVQEEQDTDVGQIKLSRDDLSDPDR